MTPLLGFVFFVSAIRVSIAFQKSEPLRGEPALAASLVVLTPVLALKLREGCRDES